MPPFNCTLTGSKLLKGFKMRFTKQGILVFKKQKVIQFLYKYAQHYVLV